MVTLAQAFKSLFREGKIQVQIERGRDGRVIQEETQINHLIFVSLQFLDIFLMKLSAYFPRLIFFSSFLSLSLLFGIMGLVPILAAVPVLFIICLPWLQSKL